MKIFQFGKPLKLAIYFYIRLQYYSRPWGNVMPQKIVCDGCGEVLYEDVDLKSPEEVIKKFNGKCPQCGKKLVFDPQKVEINSL